MKQKLIKIKSLLTISLVALLLYACERDQEGIQNSQTTVSHKQFKELIKQENFNRPVSQIQKKNEEFFEKAAMGKTAMEEEYGFTISDQLVNVVQNDTLTSYTMLITRDSIAPNEVENLIIQNTNTQNQNQAYIIKYDSNNLVSSVTPICYNANTTNRSGDECFTVAYWQCNYPGHTTDGICTHGNWVGVSVCIDGQGGGGGSSGSGNHGAGGGAGYGGGGAGYNGSIITAPVAPDYTSINLTTTLSLTQAQQDWLNMGSQSIIRKELQIYLFNNLVDNPNATNNAIAFANEMINLAIANNSSFTFDSTLNPSNAMSFNSVADFQNYLNSLSINQTEVLSSSTQGNSKNARFKKTINGFTDINVEVNQTFNPYKVNSVSSSISGNTFGLSLTQTTPNDAAQITTNGNIVTVNFLADIAVSIFIQGIGTIHTFHVTIIVKINKLTGDPISIQIIGL